jgi:hypothetical protein
MTRTHLFLQRNLLQVSVQLVVLIFGLFDMLHVLYNVAPKATTLDESQVSKLQEQFAQIFSLTQSDSLVLLDP